MHCNSETKRGKNSINNDDVIVRLNENTVENIKCIMKLISAHINDILEENLETSDSSNTINNKKLQLCCNK